MRWGERETCIFINLYLKNDLLWNTDNIDYKSKFKRLPAYQNIIQEFHAATGITLTVLEVKMKIKSLRSTYCQQLVKIREHLENGSVYKPTLKWFQQWHERFENLKKEVYDTSESNEPDEDPSLDIDDEDYDTKSDPFAANSEEENVVLIKPEFYEYPTKGARPSHKLKRRKLVSQSSEDDTSEGIQRFISESLRSMKEDEFDIYGKYIATQLRSMNLEKALRVQLQIQNIVSEARLSND